MDVSQENTSACPPVPEEEAEKAHLPPGIDADEDIELVQGALELIKQYC